MNLTITARSLAEVLLKVVGIRMLINAALTLPIALTQTSRVLSRSPLSEWSLFGGSVVLPLVIWTLGGAALLRYGSALAAWIAPDDTVPSNAEEQTISLEAIAFGVLGAYLLVLGLRDVAKGVYEIATRPAADLRHLGYLAHQAPATLVGATVQTLAGMVLLLGRSGIARTWRIVRSGTPAE